MHRYYNLTSADIVPAAKMLSRVFKKDPLFRLFYYSQSDQEAYGYLLYEFFLNYGLRTGQVYAYSPRLEGIIIWIQEDFKHDHTGDALRSGMLSIWEKIDVKAVLEITQFVNAIHQKHLSEPHWYLQLLAVDPDTQGQGIGTALMRPMLSQCDSTNQFCYLETQNTSNVTYYQRFGFQVVETIHIPNTNIQLQCMIREPQ